jgi:hypothetical protein
MVVDAWETARRVVEQLAAQSVARRIEVVLVVPSAQDLAVPPAIQAALGRVTLVEHSFHPVGIARAAGVMASGGEIVVIGETHVFLGQDWAERVFAAHAEGWSAVTPAVVNANPGSALSAAALHLDYGFFGPARPRGRGTTIPRTNASFARGALLARGDELAEQLGPLAQLPVPEEGVLHEPAIRVGHLNVDRPIAWAHERYLGGRLVGGARATTFSPLRRALYVLATPLIAGVIFARANRRLVDPAARTPTLIALLALAAVLQAAGEAVGYGTGRLHHAERVMLRYELFKWRYTTSCPA